MKKFLTSWISFVFVALVGLVPSAKAEDIDLFIGNGSAVTRPNVLIVLDNTANWNIPFEAEKLALTGLFTGLSGKNIGVGLMMFTETGGANNNVDGGYVRLAVRNMSADNPDDTGKTYAQTYANLIDSLQKNPDASNGGKAGKTMMEAYYYLTGGDAYAGNNKEKTDYRNNLDVPEDYKFSTGNALDSKSATAYNSPIGSSCAGNFIIYISNSAAQDNTSDNRTSKNRLALEPDADTSTITDGYTYTGSQDNMADEWVRYMKDHHNIVTYTIDVNPKSNGQGPGWTDLLRSMAKVGGSGNNYEGYSAYTIDEPADSALLSKKLNDIFNEIQNYSGAFTGVSLPLSSQRSGQVLNESYFGFFSPDTSRKPRWYGNLKRYEIEKSGSNFYFIDQNGDSLVNDGNGQIRGCRASWWTPNFDSLNSYEAYWDFADEAETQCEIDVNTDELMAKEETPDGPIVKKGAQAYQLRKTSPANRVVKTCTGSCTSLSNFVDSNTAVTATLSADDINWARGQDLKDENNNSDTDEMRPSAHGAVVHSKPTPLNFYSGSGETAIDHVIIFYATDDGLFKAVRGEDGVEEWAFMPPEFYRHISRLRENAERPEKDDDDDPIQANIDLNQAELIKYADDSRDGPMPKAYGMDGPITAEPYYNDDNTLGGYHLYVGMRRGGATLYAFDVPAPSISEVGGEVSRGTITPTLRWARSIGNGAWSKPLLVKTIDNLGADKQVLLVDGGYDICEDEDADVKTRCSSRSDTTFKVIDPSNGDQIRAFTTDAGTPGGFGLHLDGDGYLLNFYVPDLKGNLYRVSTSDSNGPIDPNTWPLQPIKIASLGCDATQLADAGDVSMCDRKFMFRPSVATDSNGTTNYIFLGSGDREKPVATYTAQANVQNYFYMIRDDVTDSNWFSGLTECDASTVVCNEALSTAQGADVDYALDHTGVSKTTLGWKLPMLATEQVTTPAITVFGTVYFSTHYPTPNISDPNQCGDLGTATAYAVRYLDGSPAYDTRSSTFTESTGLPPEPQFFAVEIPGTSCEATGCGITSATHGGGDGNRPPCPNCLNEQLGPEGLGGNGRGGWEIVE